MKGRRTFWTSLRPGFRCRLRSGVAARPPHGKVEKQEVAEKAVPLLPFDGGVGRVILHGLIVLPRASLVQVPLGRICNDPPDTAPWPLSPPTLGILLGFECS